MLAFLVIFVTLGRLYRDMYRQPETRALLVMAWLVVTIGVIFYMRVEGWSLLDATYFCVVTLGTVGYGDITPKTELGKLFTVFYIIFGLAVIGGFIATLGHLIDPQRLLSQRGRTPEITKVSEELEKERERLEPAAHHDTETSQSEKDQS